MHCEAWRVLSIRACVRVSVFLFSIFSYCVSITPNPLHLPLSPSQCLTGSRDEPDGTLLGRLEQPLRAFAFSHGSFDRVKAVRGVAALCHLAAVSCRLCFAASVPYFVAPFHVNSFFVSISSPRLTYANPSALCAQLLTHTPHTRTHTCTRRSTMATAAASARG